MEGISNWKSAEFYPQYWIASKPIDSAGFYLKFTKKIKREAWRDLLRSILEKKGFEPA